MSIVEFFITSIYAYYIELLFLLSLWLIVCFQFLLFKKQAAIGDVHKLTQIVENIEETKNILNQVVHNLEKVVDKVDKFSCDQEVSLVGLENRLRNDFKTLGKYDLEILEFLRSLKDEVIHQQVTRHKLNDLLVANIDKKMDF